MRGIRTTLVVLACFCGVPQLPAQRAQIQFHGTPASVTSPRIDGRLVGIPASVTDPTFVDPQFLPGTRFRSGMRFGFSGGIGVEHESPEFEALEELREHSIQSLFPVYVPYYGAPYPYQYNSSYYPPVQSPPPQTIVIVLRDERAHSSRNYYDPPDPDTGDEPKRIPAGEHPGAQGKSSSAESIPAQLPMTTLVYHDGHKSEVRNYAIVGANLIDLTKIPIMKKIPLALLDLEATRRQNEELGIEFRLP